MKRALRGAVWSALCCAGLVAQDAPQAMQALCAEDPWVRSQAALAVRHQLAPWPPEFFSWLREHASARVLVLRELAQSPRPSLDAFVQQCARTGGGDERLFALAARIEPPSLAEARQALQALVESGSEAAAAAVAAMAGDTALRLVPLAHAQLGDAQRAQRLRPFLLRLPPAGVAQLCAIAEAEPGDGAQALFDFLAERQDPELSRRIAAMLDGESPWLAGWLRRAGPLLDDARRGRVEPLLTGGDAGLAEAAFGALLEAATAGPALFAYADQDPTLARWRRLLSSPLAGSSRAAFVRALRAPRASAAERARLLPLLARTRGPLPTDLEAILVEMLQDGAAADAAAAVLLQRGAEEGARAALAQAGSDAQRRAAAWMALSRRRDPIGDSMLRAELAELQARGDEVLAQRAELQTLLAEGGADCDPTAALRVWGALRPSLLVRTRLACQPLSPPHAAQLLRALQSPLDEEAMAEGLLWLGASPQPDALAFLRSVRTDPAQTELVRQAALSALLLGPDRAALLGGLASQQQESSGALRELASAAIETMPAPLRPEDVEAAAQILARLSALGQGEARAGRAGLPPMVRALARLLREDLAAALAVAERWSELLALGRAAPAAAAVYLGFWRELAAAPATRRAVAGAMAQAVVRLGGEPSPGLGAAHLVLSERHADAGRHEAAAASARAAVAMLLCDPMAESEARSWLGASDRAEGRDPFAALSAQPHLHDALAARGRGDLDQARRSLALARDLAFPDAAACAEIDAIGKTLP